MAIKWEDPLSPEGQREITAKVLTGVNYRLFFEGVTRRKLIKTYRELTELANSEPNDETAWRRRVRKTVEGKDKQLRFWLVGLAAKTATNLGYKVSDLPRVFDEVMKELDEIDETSVRDTALLLWAGAATLTIRGSQKSTVGKKLEKSIARAALTILGLDESKEDFRLNVEPDAEVSREIDAEIRSPRGWIHVEVGMIGEGNPEVIGDKVGRINRHGVILMDQISADSTAYETASRRGIKLIQLRNNHPIEELRKHLLELKLAVEEDAISTADVEKRVLEMPLSAFDH